MPEEAPQLDPRSFEQLLAAALRRIPVHDPEWTDVNQSDPGIALVDLLAFLAETLLFQVDERQRQRNRRRRLALLVVGTAGLGALCLTLKRRADR